MFTCQVGHLVNRVKMASQMTRVANKVFSSAFKLASVRASSGHSQVAATDHQKGKVGAFGDISYVFTF